MRLHLSMGMLPQAIEGRLAWRVDDRPRTLRVETDGEVVVVSSDPTIVVATRARDAHVFVLEPRAEGTARIDVRAGEDRASFEVDVTDPATGFGWY